MAYATPEDVEVRFMRPLDEDEKRVVAARLEDAELLLRSRIPDLDEKVTAGVLDQALVVMVEAEMVLRLIRNPDGLVQETDGSYSYSTSQKVASGLLEVLPREWTLLGVRSGVYIIDPTPKMPWEA